ncbi:MAG: IdeS/Mac family cysteine endopeptidase [Candidatus Spyradosoma sp.]
MSELSKNMLVAAGIATALIASAETLRAETLFAEGITVDVSAFTDGKYTCTSTTSGWYDVNKVWVGRSASGSFWDEELGTPEAIRTADLPLDANMCWAATASNMIQWGYGQVAAGTFVPDAPAGYDASRTFAARQQLSVYKTFCDNWTDGGNTIANGLAWWLTGDSDFELVAGGSSKLKDNAGGGIYLANLVGADPKSYIVSTELIGEDGQEGLATYSAFSDVVKDSFSDGEDGARGVLGLGINYYDDDEEDGGVKGGHAITCWGCELDENGLVSALYITDSDDCVSTEAYSAEADASALEMVMRKLSVAFIANENDEEGYGIAYLTDYMTGTGYRVDTLVTFSPLGLIPEPGAFGLFAGAVALALAGTRRRRRK